MEHAASGGRSASALTTMEQLFSTLPHAGIPRLLELRQQAYRIERDETANC